MDPPGSGVDWPMWLTQLQLQSPARPASLFSMRNRATMADTVHCLKTSTLPSCRLVLSMGRDHSRAGAHRKDRAEHGPENTKT